MADNDEIVLRRARRKLYLYSPLCFGYDSLFLKKGEVIILLCRITCGDFVMSSTGQIFFTVEDVIQSDRLSE